MMMNKKRKWVLLILLLVGILFLGSQVFGMIEQLIWFSPTSSGGGAWTNALKAIDDDLDTYADDTALEGWGDWFNLYFEGSADRIRFNAYYSAGHDSEMKVEVFYDGEFHEIYNGVYTHRTWVETEFGSKNITNARLRNYDNTRYSRKIYEVEFGVMSVDQLVGNILTTIRDVFTIVGDLIFLAIGIPLAFYVIGKVVRYFPM